MAKRKAVKRRFRKGFKRNYKGSKKDLRYVQNMRIEAVPLDDDTIRVDGELDDPDHHIEVYIVVTVKDSKIIDIGTRMHRQPYPTCNEALKRAQGLIGMRIETGLYKKLSTIVGGDEGCVHLLDILMASCKMAANAIIGVVVGGKTWDDITDRDEEFHDRLMGSLEGMCVGFNKGAIARRKAR
jgi:hypothetical protein